MLLCGTVAAAGPALTACAPVGWQTRHRAMEAAWRDLTAKLSSHVVPVFETAAAAAGSALTAHLCVPDSSRHDEPIADGSAHAMERIRHCMMENIAF